MRIIKYKLIGENDFDHPIETVLHNRGVNDVDAYLKPDENDEIPYWKLKNISKATDCLLGHIQNEGDCFVQTDADCDGATSASILISYLRNLYPEYVQKHLTYGIHPGKQHGVEAKNIPKSAKLVIVPDAAVKLEEQKKIKESGKDLIIIDHHDVDSDSPYAILVNNQISPKFSSKALVGVGMVYKFLQALDDKLNIHEAGKYIDLVALGHISDIADVRDPLVHYYIDKGLHNIQNSFLKEIIKKQEYSMKGEITPISFAFYVVPLINACIRIGTQEEKDMMFRAFLGSDEKVYYKRKDEYQPIQEFMARELVNIKNRQNRERDKGTSEIALEIVSEGLNKDKVLFLKTPQGLKHVFTGLVSGQIANEYNRPVLLGTEKNGYVAGSIRGYEKGIIKDFKQELLDTGLFEFVEGHPNAAGFQIKEDNIPKVVQLFNEKYKNVQIDMEEYDVDFIIPAKEFYPSFIKNLYQYHYLWGHNCEEPLLLIKDVEVVKDDIQLLGKNSKVLKLNSNDIEYIQFKYDEDKFDQLFDKEGTYTIDVVGRCGVNEWKGNKTAQVIMKDFEIKNVKETNWGNLF